MVYMLYTNVPLKVEERRAEFGSFNGVTIGEYGRGRQEVFLLTPEDLEGEIRGLRKDLTIGKTRSGRPRINRADDGELYVILSSEREYTRRGCGSIEIPDCQDNELIARGNGADGAAGRIGTWDVVILKAHEGDVFRVIWGGYGYGSDPTLYVVHDGNVYTADQPDIEDLYDKLGIEMPFVATFDGSQLKIEPLEWKTV